MKILNRWILFFTLCLSNGWADPMSADEFVDLVTAEGSSEFLGKDLGRIFKLCQNYVTHLDRKFQEIKDSSSELVYARDVKAIEELHLKKESMDFDFIKKSVLLVFLGINPEIKELTQDEAKNLETLLEEVRELRFAEYKICADPNTQGDVEDLLADKDKAALEKIRDFAKDSLNPFFKKLDQYLSSCSTKYEFFHHVFGKFDLFESKVIKNEAQALKTRTPWERACHRANKKFYTETLPQVIQETPTLKLFFTVRTGTGG